MEELISRQSAIDAALSAADDWDGGCNKSRDKYITNALLDLPSVHPKLPENWWKTDHGYMWLCPHCGLPVHSDFEECLRCGMKRQSEHTESINQIRWERDTAIQQLAELGYGLGEKRKKV